MSSTRVQKHALLPDLVNFEDYLMEKMKDIEFWKYPNISKIKYK